MSMLHNNILSYYEKIFAFKQYHGWSVAETEALIPWELEVMTSLISNYMEAMEARRKQDATTRRSLGTR